MSVLGEEREAHLLVHGNLWYKKRNYFRLFPVIFVTAGNLSAELRIKTKLYIYFINKTILDVNKRA